MDDHLRAGLAIFNAGDVHEAHDAWEDHWLELDDGTDDERLLHGLIQFTAAFHHARERNWEGCVGLAKSASTYLQDLPDGYRGVDVARTRRILRELYGDPEVVDRRALPKLTHCGETVTLDDLDFPAAAVAARVYAGAGPYDESVVEAAIEFAREDIATEAGGPFVPLVFDFASDPENRDLVYQRLDGHVSKREHRESDVDGLFG
ncbi:DUF309 domain-containing protein [Haloarchaeobius sp. TZWWS8]|uniref:DUF309 domain-containing protein n=1 Tax=Haloarchaeobius sp. TZWWS8 TaxID=3446121 RepID=UPI003EBC0799